MNRFYHAVGVDTRRRGGGKAFLSSPSERIILMPATTAWRGSRGRLMIRNSWGFQTMANRRERRVNRCWRS